MRGGERKVGSVLSRSLKSLYICFEKTVEVLNKMKNKSGVIF